MSKQLPPPPAKPPAPPNGKRPQAPAPETARTFDIKSGRQAGGQRIVVYGPGGVGKTALCALLPKPLFIDLESGSRAFDVARVEGIETLADVRALLQSDAVDPFSEVVIDTATKLEELCLAHIIAHVAHEKPGVKITGIESYGFGKGYRHLYDAFSLVLQDCDRLVREKGKHVVLVAHSCTNEAPNPHGDNWLRYEPRLQHPKKEASVRERVIGWAEHVLFIGYDVAVDDGKGKGMGTRTIYTQEMPTHIAKVRQGFADVIPAACEYPKGDGSIWNLILGGAA